MVPCGEQRGQRITGLVGGPEAVAAGYSFARGSSHRELRSCPHGRVPVRPSSRGVMRAVSAGNLAWLTADTRPRGTAFLLYLARPVGHARHVHCSEVSYASSAGGLDSSSRSRAMAATWGSADRAAASSRGRASATSPASIVTAPR